MKSTDNKVTAIVSRVALLVALAVTLALPLGYWVIAYNDFSGQLEFKARVKATALRGLITTNPELWMYAENRLQGLLTREPVPLETEAVQVYEDRGNLLAEAGKMPAPPVLRRAYLLYDAARVAGLVEVSDSLRGMMYGTAIAAMLGILLGGSVFIALRTFPLRALRRVTDALFEQKQRAEVTLRSIGDGVITTDAAARVEFLNPVAEQLSGWALSEAKDRPLAEILHLIDATTGDPVANPLRQALAENRIVSFERDIDLVRRDGSKIGIDDSAAPIHDPDGRITGGVLIFRDVSTARAFTHQRSWEAAHDVLTGLINPTQSETALRE